MTAALGGVLAASLMVAASTGAPPSVSARDLPACAGFTAADAAVHRCPRLRHRRRCANAGGLVLQVGRFSEPPRLEDLDPLTIDAGDVSDIGRCRARDCDIKLPSAAIEPFRSGVDWRRPDHAAAVTRILKEFLHRQAVAYLEGGAPSLGAYDDRKVSVSLSAGLQESEWRAAGSSPTTGARAQGDLHQTKSRSECEGGFSIDTRTLPSGSQRMTSRAAVSMPIMSRLNFTLSPSGRMSGNEPRRRSSSLRVAMATRIAMSRPAHFAR
jgi:hypothetical protein